MARGTRLRGLIALWAAMALMLGACGADPGSAETTVAAPDTTAPDPTDAPTESTATTSAPADTTEAPAPEEMEDLTIGLVAPNQVYAPVFIAHEQGWFSDEGFTSEIVMTQSSSGSVQQAAAGSVHFAGGTPDAAVFGIIQGAETPIVATAIEGAPLSVVSGPDVEDWSQLEGQTIGVSALKGGEIALLRRLLAEKGLEEGSYDVVVSGPTPAKAAALEEGSVAAAVLFSPTDYALQDQGFNILGSTAELPLSDQVPMIVYFVNEAWAADNDRGERVARVLVRANQWLLDPANREEAIEIFGQVSNQQPEHIAATWDFWLDELEIGTPTGEIGTDEIQNVLDMMAADGDVPEPLPSPDDFLDASYIESAAAEVGG